MVSTARCQSTGNSRRDWVPYALRRLCRALRCGLAAPSGVSLDAALTAVFRWMRHFHNRAQATLVPTEELADFLQSNGFEHVCLLRRAVDTELFTPARRSLRLRRDWGVADGAPALIYVGRIAAEKNLPLAVRAFRELQARQPAARFIWVGDGPARAALAAANPDFVFCGVQRGDALAEHFGRAGRTLRLG